jgi:HEAT repeat protein
MKIGRLPLTQAKPPKNAAETVRYLRSRKADERILGLIAAWKRRPPEARATLLRIARRDQVFAALAVQVLSAYPDPSGRDALVSALNSRRPEARAAAAMAFTRRKLPAGGRAEKALARALSRDAEWRVRAGAARALGFSTAGRFGAGSETVLLARVRDRRETYPVRLESAAALARGGVDSGWSYLQRAAFAREGDRAVLALTLAAELGGSRGAGLLGTALESRRTELWTAAVRLFPLVGRRSAMIVLSARAQGDGEVARRAALALAPFEGRRALPGLLAAMERGSSVMRAASCWALARALGPEASPALERKLLDAKEASKVRAAAARALGRVGGPVVAPSLQAVSKSEGDAVVREAARDALRLVEARLKKGSEAVSEAAAERFAFARWELLAVLSGRGLGCRLRDDRGRERTYRVGEEVALGYHLARVLGAGEQPGSPEVLMAGRAAMRTDLLRAILTKGDRSVVLVRRAIETER